MKKLFLTAIILITLLLTPASTFAQGMPVPSGAEGMGTQSDVPSDDHTAREEAEGKEIWEKLQAKEVTCETLKDGDFGALGEYFMGQMVGDSHEAMNTMMERMMGEEGEEQMHIAMGKRMSGCDPDAPMPQNMPALSGAEGMGGGMMSMMMNMMMGGGGNPMMGTGWGNMMGGWGSFGILGWLSMLLFWGLLILGVVALIRYLTKSGDNKEGKTPLDILKERYARGEINKKEFEEMKKDLA